MGLKCNKNPFDITTAVIILSRHYAYHDEKDAEHFPVKHILPFLRWKIVSTHTSACPSSRSDWRNEFSAETIQRSFRVWSNGKSVFVTHRRCNISCHTLIWWAWHTLLTVDCTCIKWVCQILHYKHYLYGGPSLDINGHFGSVTIMWMPFIFKTCNKTFWILFENHIYIIKWRFLGLLILHLLPLPLNFKFVKYPKAKGEK